MKCTFCPRLLSERMVISSGIPGYCSDPAPIDCLSMRLILNEHCVVVSSGSNSHGRNGVNLMKFCVLKSECITRHKMGNLGTEAHQMAQ